MFLVVHDDSASFPKATPGGADVGPRILRHVAKEVKHEQFCDLDVLTVTVDTRALV